MLTLVAFTLAWTGKGAKPHLLDYSLAGPSEKDGALSDPRQVKKQLNLGDDWTGCGLSAQIDRPTFGKIIIYGRPRDTSPNCNGTFDYSANYCVSNEFVNHHAPPDWRVLSAPGLNMFRGPCSVNEDVNEDGLMCGANHCEVGDYCGYRSKFELFAFNVKRDLVCIKMYREEETDTFGSPTNMTLKQLEGE